MIRKPRYACARLQRRPHQCRSATRLVTLVSLLLALFMPVGVMAEEGRTNQPPHEQANRRKMRYRSNEQVVSGSYPGAMLGALLKTSKPRVNNCLSDPRALRD